MYLFERYIKYLEHIILVEGGTTDSKKKLLQ